MKRYQQKLYKKMDKIKAAEEQGKITLRRAPRALRKMLNNRLSVFGLIFLIIIIILCYAAPLFTPYDPLAMDMKQIMQPPSSEHILGTDRIGRDVFARLLYGGRTSIFIGLGGALAISIVGVTLGCYSGYKGGWVDGLVMRASEVFMSFPQLIMALLLVSITGQSLINLLLIFIITGWSVPYRLTRARMLSLREEEYALALRAFGVSNRSISFKHLLPNAIGPIMVSLTLNTSMCILNETALSFLGLGVPMEIPTWGNILNAANDFTILTNAWWIWLPVGILISLFVLSVNFIGDGLRDSTDPSQQG